MKQEMYTTAVRSTQGPLMVLAVQAAVVAIATGAMVISVMVIVGAPRPGSLDTNRPLCQRDRSG